MPTSNVGTVRAWDAAEPAEDRHRDRAVEVRQAVLDVGCQVAGAEMSAPASWASRALSPGEDHARPLVKPHLGGAVRIIHSPSDPPTRLARAILAR
jgi:hypothetical protein